ncbi:MAG: hypothetical protein WC723_02845 [Candidatus Omnitrophota bacterium]
MGFRKFLKIVSTTKAQSSLEYFILFAVIGGLTLITLSSFLPQVKQSGEDLFTNAANRIINPK